MTPGVEISKRLLLVNTASSVAVRLLRLTVLVWLYQYLLRRISPDEYAIYPVVVAATMFGPLMIELMTGGASRQLTDAYAQRDEPRALDLVSAAFPLLLVSAIVLLLGGSWFAWNLERFLNIRPDLLSEARLMMGLLILNIALPLPLFPFVYTFTIRQHFVLLNAIHLAQEVVRMAILIWLLVGISPRVVWVVVAAVSSNLVAMGVKVLVARRILPGLRVQIRRFRWETARSLLSFGAWTALGNLAHMLQQGAPVIVLNRLASPFDVTCFHLGSIFHRHVQSFASTGLAPVQPPLTAMHATGRWRALQRSYLRGGRLLLWTTLGIAVPVAVYSDELVTLYLGPEYLAAADVLKLFCATYPFIYATVMLYRITLAVGEIRSFFVGAFLTQVVSVAAMAVVARGGGGATGVAAAVLVVTALAQVVFFAPLGLRRLAIGFRLYAAETLLPGLLPAAAGLVACLALRHLAPPASWVELAAHALAGSVCYLAVLAVCLREEDRRDLLRLRRRGLAGASSPA